MTTIPPQLDGSSCFPLKDYEKVPSVKWKEYDKPLPDDVITYGVDCGRSGIVVVDVDNHNGDGEGLKEWEKILLANDVPGTFSVITPNSGLHYYFNDTSNGAIKNSAGYLAPSIDIRGNGGYVVGPHSEIKDSDGDVREYMVMDDSPIAPLPEFLKERILTPKSRTRTKIKPKEKVPTTTEPQTNDERLTRAVTAIVTATEGTRNDTLNKEAFDLARQGVEPDTIRLRLSAAAMAAGLGNDEVTKTLDSAIQRGVDEKPTTRAKGKNVEDSPAFYFSDLIMALRLKDTLLEERYGYLDWDNYWRKYNPDNGVWEVVSNEKLLSRITQWCRQEVRETASEHDADFIKASLRCLNKSTAANLAFLVKSKCLIEKGVFDQHPEMIVVSNGVVDMKNLKLLPFSPELYLTRCIDLPWNPDAKSKYLDKILDALPADTKEWFLVMAGQSLTGYQPSEDTMFFLKGNGSNGKSTILNLLTATAGEYGGLPPQGSLIKNKSGGDNFNLITFKGLRQAVVEELPDKQLDVGRMKQLTGTDSITARGLYKNNETFSVDCTIWVSCNILPQVVEYDYGTWRRIVLIEFDKTYKKKRSEVIAPNDRLADVRVRQAALHDRDTHIAFLAARIKGAHEWLKDGFDPYLPDSVVESTRKWRETGDNIRSWFNECLAIDGRSYCLNEDLRDSYNNWLEKHGYTPISHKVFLDRFENHDIFIQNQFALIRSGRTLVAMKHSSWINPKNGTTRVAGTGGAISHTRGIRFA